MHKVSPFSPSPSFTWPFCSPPWWSTVGNASRSLGFRGTASAGPEEGDNVWEKERERGMDRGRRETVGILITLGSRLRALPQQPRHFSRSYSAQQKRNPRSPSRILRARIPSALPCLEIQRCPTASTRFLTRKPHTRALSLSLTAYFPKKVSQGKQRIFTKPHKRGGYVTVAD